jgi:hypothetical protein
VSRRVKATEVLPAAEERLLELAEALDTQVPNEDYLVALLALGRRSRSLFGGFVEAARGSTHAVSFYLLRPLVEMNIVLRFLRKDSELHTQMWLAEGDRQALAFLRDVDEQKLRPPGFEEIPREVAARMKEGIAEARSKAQAARISGVGSTGRVFPSVREIVQWLDEADVWGGYVFGYRALSWNVHGVRHAYGVGESVLEVDGRVSYSDEVKTLDRVMARALAITVFSSVLCIVSEELGLGIEVESGRINTFIAKAKLVPSEEGKR